MDPWIESAPAATPPARLRKTKTHTMSVTNLRIRAMNRLAQTGNRVARWAHARFNSGDNVECELCGWKGGSFYSGRCPVCNSRSRTRLVPYAMRHFGLDSRDKVLFHLGPNKPETDWIGRNMKPRAHIIADILQFPITTLICDATRIPLPNDCVDLIITWHVLEHIPDDRGVMREMLRVLKPGAKALMSVPIVPPQRPETFEDQSVPREKYLQVYGHEDHVRACGLDYGQRFEEEGFAMREFRVRELAGSSRASDMKLFGLSPNHVVWCFEKR